MDAEQDFGLKETRLYHSRTIHFHWGKESFMFGFHRGDLIESETQNNMSLASSLMECRFKKPFNFLNGPDDVSQRSSATGGLDDNNNKFVSE